MKTVLTTTAIAEPKRFQFWQDAVCDTFVELDCQIFADRPFFGELATAHCDGLHFSTVRADGQIVTRTRTRISRAREEVMLISLQVSGTGIICQDGREARLGPGDFACYDSTRPYTLKFDAAFEQLVLHMPRDAMVRRIGRTEAWTARRVEGSSPVGSLVLPFVRQSASVVSEIAPATASRLSETCLSLVTAALGEQLGDGTEAQTAGRTALTFRAKAFIEEQLAQPRAQYRESRGQSADFAALPSGPVSCGRNDGKRLDLETAAGEEPPLSGRSVARQRQHRANCARVRICGFRTFQPPVQRRLRSTPSRASRGATEWLLNSRRVGVILKSTHSHDWPRGAVRKRPGWQLRPKRFRAPSRRLGQRPKSMKN